MDEPRLRSRDNKKKAQSLYHLKLPIWKCQYFKFGFSVFTPNNLASATSSDSKINLNLMPSTTCTSTQNKNPKGKLTWCWQTASEGVARVARHTRAHRTVIHDRTHGVCAATARARVAALLIDTCARTRALGVDGALRPTRGRRADVALQARTSRTFTPHLTH